MDKKTKIKTIGVIAISVLFMALVAIAFLQGTQVSSSPFTYASIHPLGYGMTVSNQELEQAHELQQSPLPTITTTTTTTSTIQPTTTIPQKAN